MKILAISDVHGEENENLYKYLENNDIDLVIITGDITDFGPLEFVGEFVMQLVNQVHFVYIMKLSAMVMLFYLDMVGLILHRSTLPVKLMI